MLSVEIRGQADIEVVMTQLTKALDPVEILDEAGAFLLNRIRTRFLAQVDPDGEPWMESGAARRRKKRGIGGGTLFDTGRLFRSIQLHTSGVDSRDISSDVWYGPRHNNGTDGQVRRTFLGFGEEDRTLVGKLIVKRIRKALK